MSEITVERLRELRRQNDGWSDAYKAVARREDGIITQRHDLLQHIGALEAELLALRRSHAELVRDARIGAFVRELIPKLGAIASQAGKGGNVTAYFKELDNMKDGHELHALLAGRFDLIAAIDAALPKDSP